MEEIRKQAIKFLAENAEGHGAYNSSYNITLLTNFANQISSQLEPEVMPKIADIKGIILMEIEKHDNIRMGAMIAKDTTAERTARENKKAIIELFNKLKSRFEA